MMFAQTSKEIYPSMAAQEDHFKEAEELLSDRQKIKDIVNRLGKEPEALRSAVEKIGKNAHVKRRVTRIAHQHREGVESQIQGLSYKEKKRLKANAERIQRGVASPEVPKDGVAAVSITVSRTFKGCVLPPDFKDREFYKDWIAVEAGAPGWMIFFDPNSKSKNRLASRIRGEAVGNPCLLYKVDEEGVLTPATVEEATSLFIK